MKAALNSIRRGWHQRLITGGHLALTKQNQWGITTQTLSFLNDIIGPALKRQTLYSNLRDVHAVLQTETIDQLTGDLFIVKQTMDKHEYLDGRSSIVYVSPVKRSAAWYLSTVTGRALQPHEAYVTFFNMLTQVAEAMDEVLRHDIAKDDDFHAYYTLRYASVLEEAFEVLRLFARLVGLDCPPHTTTTVPATPAKR